MTKEPTIVSMWKMEMYELINMAYPQLNNDQIEETLEEILKNNIQNPECELYNNYKGKRTKSNLFTVTDWFFEERPISTEHGVFFKNQYKEPNPSGDMLAKFLKSRGEYKALQFNYPKGADMYRKYERKQLSEKVNANSYYGVSGLKTSNFYNLHCALSTTGKGRALIAVAAWTFEAFMVNNVKFVNMDDCLVFIKNVCSDAQKPVPYLEKANIRKVYIKDILNRLEETFLDPSNFNRSVCHNILLNLSQKELDLIYYKNNLYGFLDNKYMRNLLRLISIKAPHFTNPNEPPVEIIGYLKRMWEMLEYWVFYNYPVFDRMYKILNFERKCVVTIDTDSNMLNIDPFREYMMDDVLYPSDMEGKTYDEIRFICVNTIVYMLSNVIEQALAKFCNDCNVPDEFSPLIQMKNEFLFKRILLTTSKKNYASIQELQEGYTVPENRQLDIKGLPITKSTINKTAAGIFKDILEFDILKTENIDLVHILRRLEELENYINNSLETGDKEYLKPLSVKPVDAYAKPYSMPGIRAAHVWNSVYPTKEITLPSKFDIVKVNMTTLGSIIDLSDTHPEIFEILKREVFESKIKEIADKGINVIAIPRSEPSVPDWIIKYIDKDIIITDTMKNIVRIINSIGMESIYTSANDMHYSNIVQL